MDKPPIAMQLENEIKIWNLRDNENRAEMKGDSHVKVNPELKDAVKMSWPVIKFILSGYKI